MLWSASFQQNNFQIANRKSSLHGADMLRTVSRSVAQRLKERWAQTSDRCPNPNFVTGNGFLNPTTIQPHV